MDGTVVNSGKMLAKTINAVRGHFDLAPVAQESMLQVLNDPDINSAHYFYGTETFTPQHTKLFEKYYHDYCVDEVALYEGMKELLDRYHNDLTLTIATNANTPFAKRMLNHLEIAHYFQFIIGADMVQNPKPHPEMIEKTMWQFDYTKEQTILIGDSQKDKRAALAAGINHAIVGWGFSEHENEECFAHTVECLDKIITTL